MAYRAIVIAKGALAENAEIEKSLANATSEAARTTLRVRQENDSKQALQQILATVADTQRTSPPTQVTVYQIAKDALGSGNGSGDIRVWIAYNLDALGKIAVLPVGTN